MKNACAVLLVMQLIIGCNTNRKPLPVNDVIGSGSIPNMATSLSGDIHLVYGKGDSILYSFSNDKGKTFSKPQLVDTLSKLYSFAMRGPQIVATEKGAVIIACNQRGDIFSYKLLSGSWQRTMRVNDIDTIAKEGMLAMGSDGRNHLFAVWLDLRKNKRNNLYASVSDNGGITWQKNQKVYTSPDGHICECCKPSVAMEGATVKVMFRNLLDGNRDLYIASSSNYGSSFQEPQKLGQGSWKLDGCPMDGGSLVIENGQAKTVWRRKAIIYSCEPGQLEKEMGQGQHCTLTSVHGKMIYAWVENGDLVLTTPSGKKVNMGKGDLPVLKPLDNSHVLCIWENENEIHKGIIEI